MTNISVEELKARMDAGEKLNLIDVREPNEYQEFNIGAKLVPLGKIMSMQADELDDLRNEEVILHCRSGKRSASSIVPGKHGLYQYRKCNRRCAGLAGEVWGLREAVSH